MPKSLKASCLLLSGLLAFPLLIAPSSIAKAEEIARQTLSSDWPQWRGPTRDGQATGLEAPESLAEERLTLAWRKELGPSYSGPIVVGDRVFTTATIDESTEVVRAYDRTTGEELWKTEWPGAMQVPFFAAANGSWIRATPVADSAESEDPLLYVVGIRDVLVALDQATGEQRWRIDFPKDIDAELPKFGAASSPMLYGDSIYAQMGGGFAKINKETGEIDWTVARDSGGMSGGAFSSPYLSTIDGEKIAVVQTREDLKGIDLETGAELWSQPIQAFRGMNILTPVVYQGKLFTSAHTGKSQLWEVGSEQSAELKELWKNKSQAYMSSPVVVGDHLYLHLRNQRIQCLDLATGEEAWRSKPYGKYQSMVVLGGKILALDSDGQLLLIRATPEKFDLIDSRTISEDETWAHVAVVPAKEGSLQVIVRELNALAVYNWK